MNQSRGYSLLCLVALGFALVGCAPRVRHLPTPTAPSPSSGVPTSLPSLQITPQPALLERRQLVLEWPESIREKDSGLITLTVAMDAQAQPTVTLQMPGSPGVTSIEIPNIYDTHNIVAVARLDLAGMEAYRENIREPLRPGQSVSFSWSIRANEAGDYQGVVWLRLELVPQNGGRIDEMLLLARQIDIKVVTLLGMSGSLARFLGGAGLVLSSLLGYPFIQTRVSEWLKRHRRKDPSTGRRTAPVHPSSLNKEPEEVRAPDEK